MKGIQITIVLTLLVCFGSLFVSCDGGDGGSSSDPNRGFDILTYAVAPITGTIVPSGGNVQGNFLSGAGTYGTVTTFNREHSGVGILRIPGAKVPGTWRLAFGPSFISGSLCLTYSTVDLNVNLGSEERLYCPGRFAGLTATPNTVDSLNPPASITFSGKGIEAVYGTPTLAFYDEYGNVVASSPAAQLLYAPDNEIEAVSVTIPDLSQVYDGVYTVVVHNINPDGSWEVVGAAPITIYGNPPPPPPSDGDGGCQQPPLDLAQLPCN